MTIYIYDLRKPICDIVFCIIGVLTFYTRVLSFLFMRSVYDVVHFKRPNSRGRDNI